VVPATYLEYEAVAEEQERLSTTEIRLRCAEWTSDCYSSCSQTLIYCLDAGGELAEPDHLRVLIDCAEICQCSQNSLLRRSKLSQLLATVAIEACEKCAESCRALDGSDDQLDSCADTCLQCAESCRELVL
jgi:hypothetical protein